MKLDGFGYKNVWFAVKGGDADEIIRALDLEPPGPCAWSQGVDAAYDYGTR